MISRAVKFWFENFCPYPRHSQRYKDAFKRAKESSYTERCKLKAEFDEYDNGSCLPTSFPNAASRCAVTDFRCKCKISGGCVHGILTKRTLVVALPMATSDRL